MADITHKVQEALGDRYRVQGHLGTGGMAEVFLAEDLRHDRMVAVKVVRPELAEAVGAERFVREVRITAGLTHPNIPPLLDSGEADGLLYYVMPHIEGATLSERLTTEGRMGVKDSLLLARELADALAYAHREGVVHRDVKPSNVFLEEGHALLGDFGVALVAETADTDRITSTEVLLGTVEYMSPEQCSGAHSVDARSDIYSLGCVMYEMLAGEPPFVGRSRVAVVARQIGETPPPLSVLRGDIPNSVEQIVTRCLAKAPADRFATGQDLRDALDQALRELEGGISMLPHVRSRTRALVGTGVVIVLVAVAAFLLRPTSVPALNPNRVVVFPLANRGGGENLGADVALIIGNALVQTEPLSWIDGWEQLDPEQRADPATVSSEAARRIARNRNANHYVTGGIAWSGDSVTVRLILHHTEGDSVIDQASASGSTARTTPDQLGLAAVVELMPSLVDPGRRVDLSPITDRNPAAVALWIQADKAYRSARFREALDLYRRAVDTDSLLVMAALKGARSANWLEEPALATDLIELSLRHDTILPPAHRSYAGALRAYQRGQADDAVDRYRATLELDPGWAEAWAALGEVHRHLFPEGVESTRPGSAAFREAERLDSTFIPALVHLAEEAVLSDDVDRARHLLARIQEADADPAAADWVVLMEACAFADVPRTRQSLPRAPSAALIAASQQFAAGARNPACAEVGYRSVLGRDDLERGEHWGAVVGLMSVYTIQARVAELDALLQESLAWGEGSTRFLFPLAVAAGADLTRRAEAVDSEAADMWAPRYEGVRPTTLWSLTLWNALEGDLPVARTLVRRLDEAAESRGDLRTRTLARAGRAHLLVAEGDTASALEILRGLDPAFPRSDLDYGLFEPLAPERILLAELLLSVGEPAEAYRVAALFDHPGAAMFVPFVPRSLALRVRAAEALPGADWAQRGRDARNRLESMGRLDLLERP